MRKRKMWADLPKVEVIRENLELFYRFMAERQAIWYRRMVLREPPPWTTDPVLRDYSFTNVYRELDRGTLWYLNHVVRQARVLSERPGSWLTQKNLTWMTIIYRLVNRVETFEKASFPTLFGYGIQKDEWFRVLKHMHKKHPIFTAAHLTLPTHKLGTSKIDMLKKVLDYTNKNFDELFDLLKNVDCLEGAFDVLRKIPCVGPFISYEICCDLMYVKVLPFTENDWVNPGPGCRLGIRLIFPLTKSTENFQYRMVQLRDQQKRHFGRLGLNFHYLYTGKELTLRSIEHSLCEFSKYYRIRRKSGKRRLFKPLDWPNAQGQLPMRFPREAL